MGLNFDIEGYESENDKIGSYSGFNQFREVWAKHLGLVLRDMQGFGGEKKWTNEPIQCFFHHSDCDGKLNPTEAAEVLAQAEKDYPLLKDNDQCDYSFPILIEFCKKSVELQKDIQFC